MPLGPPIQIARGPYQTMPQLLYGEPAEAYIALPDGSDFELLFLGNKTATANLLMNGAQNLSFAPNFVAPVGSLAFQKSTGVFFISNGDGSWVQYQKGGNSITYDFGDDG